MKKLFYKNCICLLLLVLGSYANGYCQNPAFSDTTIKYFKAIKSKVYGGWMLNIVITDEGNTQCNACPRIYFNKNNTVKLSTIISAYSWAMTGDSIRIFGISKDKKNTFLKEGKYLARMYYKDRKKYIILELKSDEVSYRFIRRKKYKG